MKATILDGKPVADKILKEVAREIDESWFIPKLAVILVGEDPASKIYVDRKRKVCKEVGIVSEFHEFPSSIGEGELFKFIYNLENVDGILVQLPLPSHIDKYHILSAIDPKKDVDCFTAVNLGKLAQGVGNIKPCTPSGIIELMKYYEVPIENKRITIINNSTIIGIPLALMFQQYNATVTICHKHTDHLFWHLCNTDIIITAVGKYPDFVLHPEWVATGSTVIDVAINRVNGEIFGDVVSFERMQEKTRFLSKVPGGVGPLTVACLMRNTLMAFKGLMSTTPTLKG